MRTLADDNRGSITVEMCFVMPIIVGVIMMLIMIMLKGLNEGNALGSSQVMIYEYNEFGDGVGVLYDEKSKVEGLENSIILDQITGEFQVSQDSVGVRIESVDNEEIGAISSVGCKREKGKCTDRLRRWQLYGNVLCD